MLPTILITVSLIIITLSSVAAWLNTQLIVRELSQIKTHLGIKEETKPSFFDNDLDRDV
ncbi:hypothetical protein [Bacillus sp. CGMCC 1.16541]|uniref:hypothetical protein n=1 Tax=Bacillus sp. CGMCC 1.16541 TaxID=2185143 RepID=UPI0013A58ACF|nr:hypothetical protein [Bacillus sp. CGMCC 1.16541]